MSDEVEKPLSEKASDWLARSNLLEEKKFEAVKKLNDQVPSLGEFNWEHLCDVFDQVVEEFTEFGEPLEGAQSAAWQVVSDYVGDRVDTIYLDTDDPDLLQRSGSVDLPTCRRWWKEQEQARLPAAHRYFYAGEPDRST